MAIKQCKKYLSKSQSDGKGYLEEKNLAIQCYKYGSTVRGKNFILKSKLTHFTYADVSPIERNNYYI